MTALRLFDSADLPDPILLEAQPEHEPVYRAYCSWCREFTVEPATACCAICQRPKADRYEYVEIETEDE